MSQKSTALCRKLLGWSTGGDTLQNLFAGGFLIFYSGSPPASADAAVPNTRILTYTVAGVGGAGLNFDTEPVSGTLFKAPGEVWKGTAAASGTATFYRLVPATFTTGASTTESRIQGLIGEGGDVDIVLGSTTFVSATDYTLANYSESIAVGKKSTGLANGLLGGAAGDTFKNLFNLGKIKVYAGDVPATADDDCTGNTLLATYTVDGLGTGLTFADPTATTSPIGAIISKTVAELWKATAVADGDATFFRLIPAGGTDTESHTEPRYQGTIGTAAGFDMVRGSLTFNNGSDYTLPAVIIALVG